VRRNRLQDLKLFKGRVDFDLNLGTLRKRQ
jgi:hypothetical protein